MSGADQYDVFISYTREDGEIARRLAAELASHGWLVSWDRTQIKAALATAKVVIVIWSAASVRSHGLKVEADQAFQRDVYIPVKVDDCALPAALSHVQVADLRTWVKSPEHVLPDAMIHALARRLRSTVMGEPTPARVGRPVPRLVANSEEQTALAANRFVRLAGTSISGDQYEIAVQLSQLRARPAGLVIGRVADQCDLAVPHASVSRRHALLRVGGGRLLLSDLGSTNGTMVNSMPATSAGLELTRGAVVRMGDVELTVEGVGR
jgi:hypothetical protein